MNAMTEKQKHKMTTKNIDQPTNFPLKNFNAHHFVQVCEATCFMVIIMATKNPA